MRYCRNLLVFGLVLVMLPWGAWANVVVTVANPVPVQHQMTAAPETGTITAVAKRCRIAVLVGLSCMADTVWHRAPSITVSGQMMHTYFTRDVVLPRGITPTGLREPPRLR